MCLDVIYYQLIRIYVHEYVYTVYILFVYNANCAHILEIINASQFQAALLNCSFRPCLANKLHLDA